MSAPVQNLPLGRSDFIALRQEGRIYADKTRMVYELCRDGDKIFVARPRRFGKSLLLSTFESLFKYGLRDFHGLDIENLWNDSTYSVLRLDFSLAKDYSTVEDFLQRFDTLLRDAVREAGLCMSSEGTDPIGKFSALLSSLPHLSLVLLIDEYAAPLTARLHDPILMPFSRSCLSSTAPSSPTKEDYGSFS